MIPHVQHIPTRPDYYIPGLYIKKLRCEIFLTPHCFFSLPTGGPGVSMAPELPKPFYGLAAPVQEPRGLLRERVWRAYGRNGWRPPPAVYGRWWWLRWRGRFVYGRWWWLRWHGRASHRSLLS